LVARRLFELGAIPRLLVRGPAPGGLRTAEVAEAVGVELLAEMRPEPFLLSALERGDFRPRPGGPLVRAARTTLRVLAALPAREARARS
jgi:hypothetical protein